MKRATITKPEAVEAAVRAGKVTASRPNAAALLDYYWRTTHGITIPDTAVCPGHDAPLDWATESYLRPHDCIVLANRDGGKTQVLALIECTEVEGKGIEVGHVSATLDQSDKLRRYTRKFFSDERAEPIDGDAERKLIHANGGRLDVLAGTEKGVNGPHPPACSYDEIDQSKWSVWQQALSMPHPTPSHPACMRVISSWKQTNGIMTKLLNSASETGYRVWKWCLFETVARCDKTSCEPCRDVFSHDRHGKAHSWFEVCGGKARRSNGYIPIDHEIKLFRSMDFDSHCSERQCLRPESVGQWYKNFQPHIHCISSTNTTWRPSRTAGCIVGIDEGVGDPNAQVVIQPAGTATDPWHTIVIVDSIQDADGDTLIKSWPDFRANAASYGQVEDLWGDPSGNDRQNSRTGHSPYRQVKAAYGDRIRTSPRMKSLERCKHVAEERFRVRADGQPRCYVWTETPGGKRMAQALAAFRRPVVDGVPKPGADFVHDEHSHLCTAFNYALIGLDIVMGHAPC